MAWDGNKRTVYCRMCYQIGHNRRGCPQLSEATKARYKSGDLARKCSYCYTTGHTRRKCEKLVEDMANDVRLNKEYRQKIAAFMISQGIGVGALIERLDDDEKSPYMITNINLDDLTHRDYNQCIIQAKQITSEDSWDRNFSLPQEAPCPNENGYNYKWYSCKVVAPVDEDTVRGMISAEWLTGKSGLDKHYKKRR